MDIVETASGNEDLSTLVELVTAADLVETLQGEGPFTVFAPTNDAFAALDADTLETLQDPANKDQLAAVLTYHVVPEELDAAAITKLAEDGEKITTVQGEDLTPKIDGENVTITDANGNTVTVVTADVEDVERSRARDRRSAAAEVVASAPRLTMARLWSPDSSGGRRPGFCFPQRLP